MTAIITLAASLPPLPAVAQHLDEGGFLDVSPFGLFASEIGDLAAAGIAKGCDPPTNDYFCPTRTITRGEMAAFLSRGLVLPQVLASPFTDDDDSDFEADIAAVAAAGITLGCNPPDNDRFCPDDPLTRGEMAAFLVRALHLPAVGYATFSDTGSSVFEADISRLADAGITRGCNPPANDRFCPNRSLSRAEMAAFLARALDIPTRQTPKAATEVDIVKRADWEAAPVHGLLRSHEIQFITIHHAASPPSPTGPTAFRSWQAYHQSLGWPDLAYHFIVGKDGTVYEGRDFRMVGDTATEYDPTGHFLVVLEGDFDHEGPSESQRAGLVEVLAWAVERFDIPTDELTGHRDHAATTCPGDNLYRLIDDGSLAEQVTDILAQGPVILR